MLDLVAIESSTPAIASTGASLIFKSVSAKSLYITNALALIFKADTASAPASELLAISSSILVNKLSGLNTSSIKVLTDGIVNNLRLFKVWAVFIPYTMASLSNNTVGL